MDRMETKIDEPICNVIPSVEIRSANHRQIYSIPRRSILKSSQRSDTNDTSTTTGSSSASSSISSKVKFENIKIRHYDMDLGDNPSCSIGAPVTLSWDYFEEDEQDIDIYEFERRQRRRRRNRELLLNYYQRQAILRRIGYSDEALRKAEKKVWKDQRRRQISRWMRPVAATGHFIRRTLSSIRWK